MQTVFLELVKLSLIGSLFAVAVLLVRLVFRKAPKWLFCVLWGVVALRLICPVSIESNVSLVPDRLASGQIITNVGNEYIGDVDIIYESNASYSNAVEAGRQPVYSNDGYYVITEKDSLEAPKTVGETVYPILSWIWVAGLVLMLAYTAVSYFLLRKKMEEATQLRDNIWQCEQVDSPFVLGFLKPRIYLPYAITDSDMANVIAHEQAHIQRKDHWWKPIGFLLLSIHWFNPVLWLAYILLCRDIEAACDEKVIKHMEKDEMRAYSTALLHCSVHRRRIAACPLAFGEVGVKERIKRVMNYKKPAFWIIITAVVACSIAVVCFFTNPSNSSDALPNIHSHAYVVEEVTYEGGMYSFTVIAGENSPIYRVAEDMTLASQKEVSEAGQWAELGKLEETTLTKETFDDLFFDYGNWKNGTNAKTVRRNTVKAWQLIYNQDVLYYVLQQKNGDLYLAYGYYDYSEKNDPYSDDSSIRWLFKLTMDTTGMSGMVAKSGDSAVPMLSFPKGTMIKDYVGSIYWLTINPGNDKFAPFTVWKDGEEQRGFYTAYDAITFEPLKHFIPSGLDPQAYLFQKADPTRGYIVLATFSTEPDAEIYAFGAKFEDFDVDNSKLLALVSEIANNPDCAASSNPFTFIEAKQSRYNEILTYGSKTVDCFVEQLRAGENGLQGYIMAVACADITGIGDKDLGADWATAQEWLALYDKSEKSTIIPPVIATDYISDKQAQLLSFGYTSDKAGQSVIACGIAPYQGDYSDSNTLVLDGEIGQNQILLTPQGASFSQYRIYRPDGTVYDDGTRTLYDSLSLRVINSDKGICLIAPFHTGEYIYEVVLNWPDQGLTVTYGLKVVMTGKESNYDRALDSVFAAYGEGNPLIAVTLVDKYTLANSLSSSSCYLFMVENVPNAPIWVAVSQTTGEIIGETDDPNQWLVDPPYVENQTQSFTENSVTRVWDNHHPDDSERYRFFSINVPVLNNALIEYRKDSKIYVNGEYLLGGPGNGCESFYLTDLTGDGIPELCFGMNAGSGIVDCNIAIVDYVTKNTIFTLSDRMFHDYYLFSRNGVLCVKETEYTKNDAVRTGVLEFDGSQISVVWEAIVNDTQNQSEIPGARVHVVDVWDQTTREQIACASALEKFWEDDSAEYYFACIKSQYIMVMDSTGRIVDVVTALEEGLITIETLDYYGIKYGTEPKK